MPHFHRRAPVLEAVRVATTANITISTALNNGDTLDGVTLATGDRVLVKDQSTASQNGIYEVGASPARAYDLSTDDPNFGFLVYVKAGTTNGGTLWENTNTSQPTIGSTSLTFAAASVASIAASAVTVADAGGYFTGSDVEAVLQELAAKVIGYQAHGNLGSAETFSAVTAGWHSGTLNAACTFTFTAAASGTVSSMVLELTQDGTGGWALTLPGSVVGDFTGYDTTAGTTSLLMFFSRDGGTTWYGFIAGGSGSTFATPSITLGSSAAAGAASTVIRSDSTIAAFDTTVPVTQAFGDSAATGSAAFAARRDHVHGMPAAPSGSGGSDHEHILNVCFNGDGSTTVWVLPAAPVDENGVAAYVGGSRSVDFTLSGTLLDTITFGSAPGSGTNNVVLDIEAAVA